MKTVPSTSCLTLPTKAARRSLRNEFRNNLVEFARALVRRRGSLLETIQQKGVDAVVEALEKMAEKIDPKDVKEITEVATIASNNNKEIGSTAQSFSDAVGDTRRRRILV